MRISWCRFFRRIVAMAAMSVSVSMSSAICYAQIAADNASDPVYADGWDEGDNGGHGFTGWDFDGSYPGIHEIDSASPFNQVGTAWRLGVSEGRPTDVARAGRGFAPLQIGQTLSMVIDNPTKQKFFRGYIVRLNTGGANVCFDGAPCTAGTSPVERVGVQTFGYGALPWGEWGIRDKGHDTMLELIDTDTDAGVRIDFTITGNDTYNLAMVPLDDPGLAFETAGNMDGVGAGPIDWIEFVHYGEITDDSEPTDFYVRSLTITGGGNPADLNGDGSVDAADAGLMFSNWGMTGTGDITMDGIVDAADAGNMFAAWTGDAVPPQSVPEPLLHGGYVSLAGILLLTRRRRSA